MDKSISVGDLVIVVKACCDALAISSESFGLPKVVHSISAESVVCPHCTWAETVTLVYFEPGWSPMAWVKKIPPLADLDGKRDSADRPITLDGEIERLRKMVRA